MEFWLKSRVEFQTGEARDGVSSDKFRIESGAELQLEGGAEFGNESRVEFQLGGRVEF